MTGLLLVAALQVVPNAATVTIESPPSAVEISVSDNDTTVIVLDITAAQASLDAQVEATEPSRWQDDTYTAAKLLLVGFALWQVKKYVDKWEPTSNVFVDGDVHVEDGDTNVEVGVEVEPDPDCYPDG